MEHVTDYLLEDHRAIGELLARARGTVLDLDAFTEMRRRLLRHIAIEEKVLFPAVLAREPGALPQAKQLKLEHAALGSLLVPTPDLALAGEIAGLLAVHDEREEAAGGVYERCERVLGETTVDVLARARAVAPVRASAYLDRPGLRRTAREALAAAARTR